MPYTKYNRSQAFELMNGRKIKPAQGSSELVKIYACEIFRQCIEVCIVLYSDR